MTHQGDKTHYLYDALLLLVLFIAGAGITFAICNILNVVPHQ